MPRSRAQRLASCLAAAAHNAAVRASTSLLHRSRVGEPIGRCSVAATTPGGVWSRYARPGATCCDQAFMSDWRGCVGHLQRRSMRLS